jgi:hypothetical protein
MKWGLGQWKKSPGLERRRLMEAIMLLDGVHSPVVSEKAAKFGIIVK